MEKRWWQYERRPTSQVFRAAAYIWLAFSAILFVIEIGEWRPQSLAAASSALAVATWYFSRSRQAAKIESERLP
jgi:hypothetical protein